MSRGLVLGKFMPLHKGHEALIETALNMCDKLVVLICSEKDEPIQGYKRHYNLARAFNGNDRITIEWFDRRELPQLPEDDPEFWDKWKGALSELGQFDYVFGGEPYVKDLGLNLNAAPVMLPRNLIEISGTEIRENPKAYWGFLANESKHLYQKRVCLLGPESVGKTTMTTRLGVHFQATRMYEYGRTYQECLKDANEDWKIQDFRNIVEGHKAIKETLAKKGKYLIIEDTDHIATEVWCETLINDYINYNHLSNADLYILLAPTVQWVDDGSRIIGDTNKRWAMYEKMKDSLRQKDLKFVIINPDDFDHRFDMAIKAVRQLLVSHPKYNYI